MRQDSLEINFLAHNTSSQTEIHSIEEFFPTYEQDSTFQLMLVFFLISRNQPMSSGKANTGNNFLTLLSW